MFYRENPDWYEDDIGYDCNECKEYERKLNECTHFFEGILEQLSSEDGPDIKLLEHCFEELGHLLGLKDAIKNIEFEKIVGRPTDVKSTD